jgi:dihydrodiol dehydrogenase / D-xylose 1-dehydrogenase (NADP)
LGGGTILDLGIYALQLTQLVFKGASPLNMAVIGGLNEDGVDEYTSSIWKYPGDRIACLSTSGKAEYPNEAVIIGTRGIIRIPEFWCPTKMLAPEKTYEFKLPTTSAKFNFHNSVGLLFEAEHARKCVKSGMIESPLITHAESIQLASYMDALRTSVGVVFEEDKK